MLTHLIILLDDTSVSYCHYKVTKEQRNLISLDDLKAGIIYAMKENLNIQFVYPSHDLPVDYQATVESIDHIKIKPISQATDGDIIVLDSWDDVESENVEKKTCIVKTTRSDLKKRCHLAKKLLSKVKRLNIAITDIDSFTDNDIEEYQEILTCLTEYVIELYRKGSTVQLNLLTDRAILTNMNNCNAGYSNVTLAPNGKFYICPAFYYDNPSNHCGELNTGVKIKNDQLLRLDHAPICRHCDAFQCKRCVWLNKELTLDINTPSHQQCVVAHLERNASRDLLLELDKAGVKLSNSQFIEKMTELDPFNIVNKWK